MQSKLRLPRLRKCVLAIVMLCVTFLFLNEAKAGDIVGNWGSHGDSGPGLFTSSTFFGRDGTFQFEMAVVAKPGSGLSNSVNTCRGRYQFDGQTVSTQTTCSNGHPLTFYGPVRMIDDNTMTISGDTFVRR